MSSIQCLAVKCCYFRRFRNGLHIHQRRPRIKSTLQMHHPRPFADCSSSWMRSDGIISFWDNSAASGAHFKTNITHGKHIPLTRNNQRGCDGKSRALARYGSNGFLSGTCAIRFYTESIPARSQAQAERRVVERTLIDIYDIRHHMEPSVQELLNRDITDHFSKTLTYNKIGLRFTVRSSSKASREPKQRRFKESSRFDITSRALGKRISVPYASRYR